MGVGVDADRSAAAVPSSFLLCLPGEYDTTFLFNPHMTYRERVDRRKARAQWRRLVRVLEEAGAELDFLEPPPGIGPTVFTADGAFCYRGGDVLVLRNDGIRGDVEPDVFGAWFKRNGYRIETAPPNYRLDGGNLLRLDDGDVLVGTKPGSTGLGERYLARLLRLTTGGAVHRLPLVDDRYLHLDTAVGVLGGGRFLVYRGAFPDGTLPEPLATADVVDVSSDDAARFACNTVLVGDVLVTGPVSEALARRIRRLGLHVERVDLSEFYKAGGGAKCLTLPLLPPGTKGEEGT